MVDPIASPRLARSSNLRRPTGLALFSHRLDGRLVSWNRRRRRSSATRRPTSSGETDLALAPGSPARPACVWSRRRSWQASASTGSSPRSSARTGCGADRLSFSPVTDAPASSSLLLAWPTTSPRRASPRRPGGGRAGFREWRSAGPCRALAVGRGTDAVQWSDEFHRIHGVDPLDFEGTFAAHLTCVHPADRDAGPAAMEGSVVTGQLLEDEYRIVRRRRDSLVRDAGRAHDRRVGRRRRAAWREPGHHGQRRPTMTLTCSSRSVVELT